MTPEELEAIRARCEAATPGPWEFEEYIDYFEPTERGWQVFPIWELIGSQDNYQSVVNKHDADFIAHARTDIPALLAYITELTMCDCGRKLSRGLCTGYCDNDE